MVHSITRESISLFGRFRFIVSTHKKRRMFGDKVPTLASQHQAPKQSLHKTRYSRYSEPLGYCLEDRRSRERSESGLLRFATEIMEEAMTQIQATVLAMQQQNRVSSKHDWAADSVPVARAAATQL